MEDYKKWLGVASQYPNDPTVNRAAQMLSYYLAAIIQKDSEFEAEIAKFLDAFAQTGWSLTGALGPIRGARGWKIGLITAIRVRVRAAMRLGAYKRGIEQGMSSQQARAFSDQIYPPTSDDLAYEEKMRRKHEAKLRS